MSWVIRIIKQLGPMFTALFGKPGRENPAIPESRPSVSRYTSDTEIQIVKDFLTLNRFSRPGRLRKGVKGIEVHWVANPGSSAKATRSWFEGRKGGRQGFGSTHFVIDLDGDIIQMIPEKEIAFSSGAKRYQDGVQHKYGTPPYYNTLSIECTHVNWEGAMTDQTRAALLLLCIHLCKKYKLTARDLCLHYDLTGKNCHRWFVDNPKEWAAFRNAVDKEIKS